MHILTNCSYIPKKNTRSYINKIIGSSPYSPRLEDQKPDWPCKFLLLHHKQISYFPRKPIISKLITLGAQRQVIRIYSIVPLKFTKTKNVLNAGRKCLMAVRLAMPSLCRWQMNENKRRALWMKGGNQSSPIRRNTCLLITNVTRLVRIVFSVIYNYDISASWNKRSLVFEK